jgi:hypothetical protein
MYSSPSASSACDAGGRAPNRELCRPISHLPIIFRSRHGSSSRTTANWSIGRKLNLPQTWRQVLGAGLNCSEMRRRNFVPPWSVPRLRLLRRDATQRPTFARPRTRKASASAARSGHRGRGGDGIVQRLQLFLGQPSVLPPHHTPEPSLPMKPFPLLTKHD